MSKDTVPNGRAKSGQTRQERQKAALKANMARRKAQARARSAQMDSGARNAQLDNDAQNDTENEGKGPAIRGE